LHACQRIFQNLLVSNKIHNNGRKLNKAHFINQMILYVTETDFYFLIIRTRRFEFDVYLELYIFGALVNYRNLSQIYMTQRTHVMIMNCDLCR
jgi:hypothetical protein